MKREKELALLDECLALAEARTQSMADAESEVRVDDYVNPRRFAAELEVLFRGSPNLVAHVSEVPEAGTFMTRTQAGIPLLVARDEQGVVRAFLNVCRHRGATVELRERGECKKFVCPYHAWTYRLDGTLAGMRLKQGFPSVDPDKTTLVPLPAIEAAGFIWVVPSPKRDVDVAALLPPALLGEFEWLGCRELEVFRTVSKTWRANWKLIADGGLESYHFRVAHKESIGGFFLDTGSTFETIGDHTRTVIPRTTLLELRSLPREEWAIRRVSNVLYSLFPAASLLVQEDHVVLVRSTPVAIDETRIEITTLAPKGQSEESGRHFALNHKITTFALDEDFAIAEQIQRGLSTGANEVFRLGRYESAIALLHQKIERRLAAHG